MFPYFLHEMVYTGLIGSSLRADFKSSGATAREGR